MDKLFRQIKTSDRMPTEYKRYDTNIGNVHFLAFFRQNVDWWLEEIKLPSEEEIKNEAIFATDKSFDAMSERYYIEGANYILNTLKGEKSNV